MYGGGRATERKISVGELSEEWLILGSTMRTVTVVNKKWKYLGVCCVVGVSKADWGCGRWIVEVYKRSPRRIHLGFLSLCGLSSGAS